MGGSMFPLIQNFWNRLSPIQDLATLRQVSIEQEAEQDAEPV